MLKRFVFVSLLAVVPVAAQMRQSEVTVHEWGTFTSVAAADGSAEQWRPLAGQSDLPCFVASIPNNPKVEFGAAALTAMKATVRMETPVLYFYSPRETSVRVHVGLAQGVMTEWYPYAIVQPTISPFDLASASSSIDWNRVDIGAGQPSGFLTEPGQSHYYAARDTDALPIKVGEQSEKFLFYRGMASFPVRLGATVSSEGIALSNTGPRDIDHVIVFENRGGRIGYRAASAPRGVTHVSAPDLSNDVGALKQDLERLLVAQGLFPREAHAMVETWRDSWFEEGARVFYLLPQASVDEVLPLTISPAPAKIVRAFVGRLEVFTPALLADVERGLAANDLRAVDKYGRFLESIVARVLSTGGVFKTSPRLDRARVDNMLRLVAASHVPEGGCR